MTNKNINTDYYVAESNPEIFDATPRPGGLANIDVPPKRSLLQEASAEEGRNGSRASVRRKRSGSLKMAKSKELTASTTAHSKKSLLTISSTAKKYKELDIDSVSREYKVHQAVAATPWSVEFDEYMEHTQQSSGVCDPFQDSVDMLSMSITVVMLMARDYHGLSENHFRWIVSYLDCIRDEFGNIPPNIQAILNHIYYINGKRIISFLREGEPIEERKAVVTIEEPKRKSKPSTMDGRLVYPYQLNPKEWHQSDYNPEEF